MTLNVERILELDIIVIILALNIKLDIGLVSNGELEQRWITK
tara:strand:- start:574 stop:699 length:126 start_codon:yes stop_codon:yes gene_type:complete